MFEKHKFMFEEHKNVFEKHKFMVEKHKTVFEKHKWLFWIQPHSGTFRQKLSFSSFCGQQFDIQWKI